jgi:hypothetical protein
MDGKSEAPLKEFCGWFLTIALDHVRFSTTMFDLGRIEARYRALVQDAVDDKRAPDFVSAVLRHGSLPRGEAHLVLKTSERTARNTLQDLVDRGSQKADTPTREVPTARLQRAAVSELGYWG